MPAHDSRLSQKIKIAGIAALVHCNSGECLRMVRDFFNGFSAGGSEKEKFTINIGFSENGTLPFPEDTKIIGDNARTYFMVKDLFGVLDRRTKTAEAQIVRDKNLIPAFIRSIYLAIFHEHGAALLHSSAYIEKGRAHLFLGRSGSGKSTVARANINRKGVVVVDEDMNIIRRERGRFMLYSHPFAGANERAGYLHNTIPGPVEIGSANILHKANENSVRKAGAAEAASTLLYCTYMASNSTEMCGALIDLYKDFASNYSVNDFRFTRDRPFLGDC